MGYFQGEDSAGCLAHQHPNAAPMTGHPAGGQTGLLPSLPLKQGSSQVSKGRAVLVLTVQARPIFKCVLSHSMSTSFLSPQQTCHLVREHHCLHSAGDSSDLDCLVLQSVQRTSHMTIK